MRTHDTILYFLNGSIGDFLMVLFLMENIHANDPSLSLFIVTPRNYELFQELADSYPYIHILHAHRGNALSVLARFGGRRNCCIIPPTPGHNPLSTKLVARALSLRGSLIGFDDGYRINAFLYSHRIRYDFIKPYYESLLDVLAPLGFVRKKETITFAIERVPSVFVTWDVSPGKYVVLHPFGSSPARSIEGDELVALVRCIQKSAPESAILISGNNADRARVPKEIEGDVTLLAGRASMSELATLLERCGMYIGVDTSVTHLASLLRVRSLVIAHTGSSPNWLPYYNENATIIYQVAGDTSGITEGHTHLEDQRKGRVRYLDRLPEEVVEEYVTRILQRE